MYCLLVIYNGCVHDSVSYQFINQHKDIDLIVLDNSTRDYKNESLVKEDGHTYISMGGNMGLSKAYNAGLDYLAGKSGKVILLDDDTVLNDAYLKDIQDGFDIQVPVVKDELAILSPCDYNHGRICRWDGCRDFDLSAINSGLVMDLSLFSDYRYDENLFLDFVDHKFFRDMKDKRIRIMDSVIRQNFSGNSNSEESSIVRFKIFKKDCKYFYGSSFNYWFVILKRRLSLCKQFKSLKFLFL